MSRSSTAAQLVELLRQAGVERVYGVVGDSLNPFVDAIRTTEGIAWVHVRNEEAGAFAAAAEAQLTGRLAVCAGSCGPGNAHLIQGLYDAHRSGAPVLAIASHIPPSRSAPGSSRRPTQSGCSSIAAATASWSASRPRCPGSRASRSSTRSGPAACRCW
jgi:pyruvate dehydrogenase (quinone)